MKAIQVRFEVRPSRFIATAEGGHRATVSSHFEGGNPKVEAVRQIAAKAGWLPATFIVSELPNGDTVFVFSDAEQVEVTE
jgi:hypothetical protein